jgi:hypothetical protein
MIPSHYFHGIFTLIPSYHFHTWNLKFRMLMLVSNLNQTLIREIIFSIVGIIIELCRCQLQTNHLNELVFNCQQKLTISSMNWCITFLNLHLHWTKIKIDKKKTWSCSWIWRWNWARVISRSLWYSFFIIIYILLKAFVVSLDIWNYLPFCRSNAGWSLKHIVIFSMWIEAWILKQYDIYGYLKELKDL